jgi:hypothetical protein
MIKIGHRSLLDALASVARGELHLHASCLLVTIAALLAGAFGAMAAELRDVGTIPVPTLALPQADAGPSSAPAVGAALARGLGLDPDSSLHLARTLPLPRGGWSFRYDQLFRGVPVWGRQVIAHQTADGRLAALSGTAVVDIGETSAPNPRLGAAEALAIGTGAVAGQQPGPIENAASDRVHLFEDDGDLRSSIA